MKSWQKISKIVTVSLLATLIAIYPFQERSALAAFGKIGLPGGKSAGKLAGKISEASPPEVIQELREALDDYQPQVKILSPKNDEVLDDTTASVRFQVNDLPLFKDEKLGLGPHLHVFLDDQPYQPVYSTKQPLVLENLTPGTHTLRVFASRPWHESFKNEGAYAQTTFHVFTKTQNNRPNPDLPLLTYSRPQGSYGAEPIMLDFYLTNAPLHLVAQEDNEDDIADWRIRVTANGDKFVLDRWQPIYLKGFKPGKNWVQIEYLDEKGNPIPNVFNNTARLITLEPDGQDTLSKLVRGELTVTEARGIVDPNYVPPVVKQPEPSPEPTPEVEPGPSVEPKADRVKPRETVPIPIPVVPVEPKERELRKPETANEKERPTPIISPNVTEPIPSEAKPIEKSRTNRYLDKLRQSRPAKEEQPEIKRPEPALEKEEPAPARKPVVVEPKPEPSPSPVVKPRLEPERSPILTEEKPAPVVEKTKEREKSIPRWLDQLKQSVDRSKESKPLTKPVLSPTPEPSSPVVRDEKPERIVTPVPKATVKLTQPTPQKPVPTREPVKVAPKSTPELSAPEPPTAEPSAEPVAKPAVKSKESPVKGWFDKVREQIDSRKPTPRPTTPIKARTEEPTVKPSPIIRDEAPKKVITPTPRATIKPDQSPPAKAVPGKESIQVTPRPTPEVTVPKATPSPEVNASPEKAKESPVKGWFDRIREQIDSKKPASRPIPTQSVPTTEEIKSRRETPIRPTVPPTSPVVESPKPATATRQSQQSAKDYYEQLRRPIPSPTVTPGETRSPVSSTPRTSFSDEGQNIPSALSAPGRNVPLGEETPGKAGSL